MAMANAELANGAIPISTDFVEGLHVKVRPMPFALAVQNIISGLHMKQCAIHPFLQKQVTRSITVCG